MPLWTNLFPNALQGNNRKTNPQQNLCKTATLKKRLKVGFQYQLSLKGDQKYCRMGHFAILLTFNKLPFVI